MIENLVKKGFGVAVWTVNNEMFVRLRYKQLEIRESCNKRRSLDELIQKTAMRLVNEFPEKVSEDLLK